MCFLLGFHEVVVKEQRLSRVLDELCHPPTQESETAFVVFQINLHDLGVNMGADKYQQSSDSDCNFVHCVL